MTNNSSCQTECCVACDRELQYCECEAGLHIYGDQHNITWEDKVLGKLSDLPLDLGGGDCRDLEPKNRSGML